MAELGAEDGVANAEEWIVELIASGFDRNSAFFCLKAVLQALRDGLRMREAVQLGDQLPALIRGFYYESWEPGKPLSMDRGVFINRVHSYMGYSDVANPEEAVKAVFSLLQRRISYGEVVNIKRVLPKSFMDLWPDAAIRM